MSESDAMWEAFLDNEVDRLPLLVLADWHEERGEANSAYWVRWLANSNRSPWGNGLWQSDRENLSAESLDSVQEAIPVALFRALPQSDLAGLDRSFGQDSSARHYVDRRAAWDALRAAMAACPPP